MLVYLFVLGGLGSVNGAFIAAAFPLVLYVGAVLVFRPSDIRLHVSRSLSRDYVPASTEVRVELTITNEGAPLDEVMVADEVPKGLITDRDPSVLLTLGKGESYKLIYRVEGMRGSYKFGETRVTAREHFGLYQRHRHYSVTNNLYVVPQSPKIRSIKIRPLRTRGYAGPIPSRQGGSGTDFYGIRAYQPGDPPQWINWRLSARHPREIFTNEFERERIADVGVILDARERSNVTANGESLFEYAVEVAASLADSFLSDGNRVGLLVYGRGLERTLPDYGKIQRRRILQALAQARVGDSLVFDSLDYLPTRFFPAKSQIVLVSPLCDDDPPVLTRLRARGYQILIVSPDPVEFEARGESPGKALDIAVRIARAERQLVIHRLQRVGISVIEWQVGQSLDSTMRAGLQRYAPQALRR